MTGAVTLYRPEYRDLWFRQSMLADPETMAYNLAWGGVIPFPEEAWKSWYSCWLECGDGSRFYRYVVDEADRFAGETAYHFDPGRGIYLAHVLIYAPFRGRGLGSQALELLCCAATENGVNCLYDDIAADNPSVALFLKHGFTEEYRTDKYIMLRRELRQATI